jgi:hypothetical protein
MIPQRMLGNEFSNSGVRNRVTACRKRLRENRVMVKAHAVADIEELFSEDAASMGQVTELGADGARSSALSEQEVGMT